jgi:hypothetical protein
MHSRVVSLPTALELKICVSDGRHGYACRELEFHHDEALFRANQAQAELSAQVLRTLRLQRERASISAHLLLATAAAEEAADLRQQLAQLQQQLSQQQQQQRHQELGQTKPGTSYALQYFRRVRESTAAGAPASLNASSSSNISVPDTAPELQQVAQQHGVQDQSSDHDGAAAAGHLNSVVPGNNISTTDLQESAATLAGDMGNPTTSTSGGQNAALRTVAYILSPARRAPRPQVSGGSGLRRVSHVVLGTRRVVQETVQEAGMGDTAEVV